MTALDLCRKLIRACLQLNEAAPLSRETPLLGGFAEFDSLTITTLIAEIEEALDCEIADEELSGELFETIGTLTDFIDSKMAHA